MNRKNLKEKPLPLVESIIDQSSLLPRFEIRTKGVSFFWSKISRDNKYFKIQ